MRKLCVLLLLLAFAVPAAHAGDEPGHIKYEEHQLKNGLRVILSEDNSVPIVAVDVWYHVGSSNEEEGRSGFAHLFEHMMFQGSENVGKAEHFQFVARAGGNCNGSTNEDRTNYFEVVPANRMNLALWLEADRMRSLKITPENFENQRETVKEERRQRVDNQPYAAAFLTTDTLAYDYKPYSHTVIGKMVDLDAAQVEDVQNFFDLNYAPNNAVLVIVGDIDKGKTMKMVEKYFGDIPRGNPVPPVTGAEPAHTAERRMTIDDKNANVPAIFIAYSTPPHLGKDTPALAMLSKILVEGESSRIHKRLVKDEEAALAVFGMADSRKGPSLFKFIAVSNMGVDITTCEDLIYDEIEKLKTDGIYDDELDKAKVQFKADYVRSRQTVLRKAEALQHYAFYHDDMEDINRDLNRYMSVTKEEVVAAARKYFTPENRTVVIANPVKE